MSIFDHVTQVEHRSLITPTHITFAARVTYHPHDCGSFVLDSDGHDVGAVHHEPE